jgi:hypothetical protein
MQKDDSDVPNEEGKTSDEKSEMVFHFEPEGVHAYIQVSVK